ncbi:hypothetical protein MIMGU_mgv1a0198182mg, partial [Erythranthe guttata]
STWILGNGRNYFQVLDLNFHNLVVPLNQDLGISNLQGWVTIMDFRLSCGFIDPFPSLTSTFDLY